MGEAHPEFINLAARDLAQLWRQGKKQHGNVTRIIVAHCSKLTPLEATYFVAKVCDYLNDGERGDFCAYLRGQL